MVHSALNLTYSFVHHTKQRFVESLAKAHPSGDEFFLQECLGGISTIPPIGKWIV